MNSREENGVSDSKADRRALVHCLLFSAISAILWLATVAMIVVAFVRNDPALVGASAYCFIAASALLAFAVWVIKAGIRAVNDDENT